VFPTVEESGKELQGEELQGQELRRQLTDFRRQLTDAVFRERALVKILEIQLPVELTI
jgi:hypothetical protein